ELVAARVAAVIDGRAGIGYFAPARIVFVAAGMRDHVDIRALHRHEAAVRGEAVAARALAAAGFVEVGLRIHEAAGDPDYAVVGQSVIDARGDARGPQVE